jgi:hypothetical protein
MTDITNLYDVIDFNPGLDIGGSGWGQQVNDAMVSIIADHRHGVLSRHTGVTFDEEFDAMFVPQGYQAYVEQVWFVRATGFTSSTEIRMGAKNTGASDWYLGDSADGIHTLLNDPLGVVIFEPNPGKRDNNEVAVHTLYDGDTAYNTFSIYDNSISTPAGQTDVWVLGTVWKK